MTNFQSRARSGLKEKDMYLALKGLSQKYAGCQMKRHYRGWSIGSIGSRRYDTGQLQLHWKETAQSVAMVAAAVVLQC